MPCDNVLGRSRNEWCSSSPHHRGKKLTSCELVHPFRNIDHPSRSILVLHNLQPPKYVLARLYLFHIQGLHKQLTFNDGFQVLSINQQWAQTLGPRAVSPEFLASMRILRRAPIASQSSSADFGNLSQPPQHPRD
jgi:hypothetical protein